MVLLKGSCYLITFRLILKPQASLSFQPQDAIKPLDPGLALIQERDPIEFTNSEPVDFFAAHSDFDTLSDGKPNDITFDQTHLEGDNFLPSQSNLISASVPGAEINKQPTENSQDSALLPWDGNDGVLNFIPKPPSLSLPSFPNINQVFENMIEGGVRPEEPDCDDGLFSFCCELGPPNSHIRKGTSANRILEIEAIRKQRLRECVKCLSLSRVSWHLSLALDLFLIGSLIFWGIGDGIGNKNHPACQFPENEACCLCLSLVCTSSHPSNLLNLTVAMEMKATLITFQKK